VSLKKPQINNMPANYVSCHKVNVRPHFGNGRISP